MKYIFFVIAFLVGVNSQAQITKATIQASGLTCAMCSKAVYKALSAVPFVDKVQANIELSSFDLTFKPGRDIEPDALSKAVVDAGFSIAQLKLNTKFHDTKVQNDAHVTVGDKSFHFINVSPQTIDGDKTIVLVDKNFVSVKDYKKYGKLTSFKCYESGMMDGKRMYHVTM